MGTKDVARDISEAPEAGHRRLGLADFADLFGASPDSIPQECRTLIDRYDFRFRALSSSERDATLVDVLTKIDSDQFSLAGKEGKPRWEKGWSENLESFRKEGGNLSALVPKYIRKNQPIRLHQEYVLPSDGNMELNWYEIFRLWLFKTYLRDVSTVYEFGCGSGFNLAVMAQLFPDKTYHGLDWASASRDIVDEMAKNFRWRMTGHLFDFFAPDESLKIDPNSAIVTIGALEQTGRDYEAFLQYLLNSRAKICIHVEPIVEWYDANSLVDYAAIRFHRKRKYWEGFPERLAELEKAGRVQILKKKRAFFGSLYLEGYSQLFWRPLP
jgi:hypothetical protein